MVCEEIRYVSTHEDDMAMVVCGLWFIRDNSSRCFDKVTRIVLPADGGVGAGGGRYRRDPGQCSPLPPPGGPRQLFCAIAYFLLIA